MGVEPQIVSMAVSDLADFVTCYEAFFLQMSGGRSLHNRGCDLSLIRKYILMNGNPSEYGSFDVFIDER